MCLRILYCFLRSAEACAWSVQTLKSTQAMSEAMRGATRAMGAMNRQMNLPALQKIMRDFEMQNERMEMTSEVMGDAVDDVFEACPPNPASPLPESPINNQCSALQRS